MEECKRFGSPRNWDSERTEHFHIHKAKKFGRRAHKCRETFERSAAQRLADSVVIDKLHELMMPSDKAVTDTSIEEPDLIIQCRGTTVEINQDEGMYSATWYTRCDGNMMTLPAGLATFLCETTGLAKVVVKTEIKYEGNIYRCHPWYMDSAPRYDWLSVLHARNQERPCKLLAVIPADDNKLDETLLVVQCASKKTGVKSTLFTEWEMDAHFVTITADMICGPRFVLILDEVSDPNIVAECLDYSEWPNQFTYCHE